MNSIKSIESDSNDPDSFASFLISSILWGMVLSLVGVASFLGYKYFTADPPGYCRAQDRYIADEEFLKATLDIYEWENKYVEVLAELAREQGSKEREHPYLRDYERYIKFHSVRDLRQCCLVNREQTKPIIRRMFNVQVIKVELYAAYWGHIFYLPFNECGVIAPDGEDGLADEIVAYARRIGEPITIKNYRKTLFLKGK